MELNKEMIRGYIESIILIILKNKDLYGYDLIKKISELSKNKFEIKEGTVYVVLKRLENKGLILSYWGDEESNGGRRRYHKITNEGMTYIKRKKAEWLYFKDIIDIFFEEV